MFSYFLYFVFFASCHSFYILSSNFVFVCSHCKILKFYRCRSMEWNNSKIYKKTISSFFADCADEIFLCQKTLLALVSVQQTVIFKFDKQLYTCYKVLSSIFKNQNFFEVVRLKEFIQWQFLNEKFVFEVQTFKRKVCNYIFFSYPKS